MLGKGVGEIRRACGLKHCDLFERRATVGGRSFGSSRDEFVNLPDTKSLVGYLQRRYSGGNEQG